MSSELGNIQDLLDAEEQFLQAERDRSIPFLEARLTDDFVGIGPMGYWLGKQAWIERYRSGDFTTIALESSDVQTRTYGSIAIVTSILASTGAFKGTEVRSKTRCTHVMVRHLNGWLLAHAQMSSIGDGVPGAPAG